MYKFESFLTHNAAVVQINEPKNRVEEKMLPSQQSFERKVRGNKQITVKKNFNKTH